MLKVAVISHSCVVGENQKIWSKAGEKGIEVHLIFPERWLETYRGKMKSEIIENPDFYPHPEKAFLPPFQTLHTHFYYHPLKILKKISPRMVLIDEEPFSIPSFQFSIASLKMGIPFVIYTKENIFKKFPPPFSWIEKFVLKKASGAIALTEEVREVLRKKNFNKEIFVIPHGIDENLFTPQKDERKEVVIGYAGRIWKDKGIFDFLSALKKLHHEISNIKGLIVGRGPDENILMEEIRNLEYIEYIPGVPHSEMHKVYKKMDIIVLPSRTTKSWKEQLGRVLIEGAMCGVYPIGSSSGEIPNVVRNLGGKVFEEKNVDELFSLLKSVIEKGEYAGKREEVRRNAVFHYSLDRVAEKIKEAIHNFI